MTIQEIIRLALNEDIGVGDHTSLATIPQGKKAKARLLAKEQGVICGIGYARDIFREFDPEITFRPLLSDGSKINPGDVVFTVEGNAISLLSCERLVLNILQRLSGIATHTHNLCKLIDGYPARLLDTRKTTPLLREMEKYAVKTGGGENHRFGLYDMIMIKDNHVDYAGGIRPAIRNTRRYLNENNLHLRIEIEVRNFAELEEVLSEGGVDRIMLDNFSPQDLEKAVVRIGKQYETEASGGITARNLRDYAATGVDYISVGALTHQIKSIDLSLKAF
jgi:nicotinate-nucleotide pyrophosphorylase (carboxylating)